jgi:hypothetical protein
MVKIYNSCDSEVSFLNSINSRIKGHEINSIERFFDFEKDLEIVKNKDLEENEKNINDLEKENEYLNTQNSRTSEQLKDNSKKLFYKFKNISGKYGDLRDKIQNEIDILNHEKSNFEKKLNKNKDIISENLAEISILSKQKLKEIMSNYEFNKNELIEIRKNKKLMCILKGAIGENSVKNYIENKFKNDKTSYLINTFDIDLKNEGIYIQDKTLIESKIDHLFISNKGIFILETKAWKSVNETRVNEVENQLERYSEVFKNKFSDILNQNLEIILIYTKKEINLDKKLNIKSLSINNFEDYINNKSIKLNSENLINILNEISPFVKSFSILEKLNFKSKKSLNLIKKFISSKFNSKEIKNDGDKEFIESKELENHKTHCLSDSELFEKLKSIRKEISTKNKIKAYLIFNDKTLKELSEKRPNNKTDFLKINGVGEKKFDLYGDFFLDLIK